MSLETARSLMLRIGSDPAFRKQLETSPLNERKGLLASAGYGDVTQADIQAISGSTAVELSDAELEAVAGGSCVEWVQATAAVVGAAAAAA